MNKIREILQSQDRQSFAINAGLCTHKKLQNLFFERCDADDEISQKIAQNKILKKAFCLGSKTEVPIAGYLNGKLISRRIDRLYIDNEEKTVYILDYKTDTDKSTFIDDYKSQIKEYKLLLKKIYPNYNVLGFILWLQDFSLTEIN